MQLNLVDRSKALSLLNRYGTPQYAGALGDIGMVHSMDSIQSGGGQILSP